MHSPQDVSGVWGLVVYLLYAVLSARLFAPGPSRHLVRRPGSPVMDTSSPCAWKLSVASSPCAGTYDMTHFDARMSLACPGCLLGASLMPPGCVMDAKACIVWGLTVHLYMYICTFMPAGYPSTGHQFSRQEALCSEPLLIYSESIRSPVRSHLELIQKTETVHRERVRNAHCICSELAQD